MATSITLSLKVLSVQVQTPWLWRLAGGLAGQNPDDLIREKITEIAGALAVNAPRIDHVKLAFQGVNRASKGDSISLGLRSDALIDKQAITSALA